MQEFNRLIACGCLSKAPGWFLLNNYPIYKIFHISTKVVKHMILDSLMRNNLDGLNFGNKHAISGEAYVDETSNLHIFLSKLRKLPLLR